MKNDFHQLSVRWYMCHSYWHSCVVLCTTSLCQDYSCNSWWECRTRKTIPQCRISADPPSSQLWAVLFSSIQSISVGFRSGDWDDHVTILIMCSLKYICVGLNCLHQCSAGRSDHNLVKLLARFMDSMTSCILNCPSGFLEGGRPHSLNVAKKSLNKTQNPLLLFHQTIEP